MKRLIVAALALPHLAAAQVPQRMPLPGTRLERPEGLTRDPRPVGPAPGMIYGTALGPTTAKVTWSPVPAANGYQLYRSGGGSTAATLIHSVAATPGLVLAVNPTAYAGPVIPPVPIKWGGTVNTIPPIAYRDLRRSPKTRYIYTVVATYPDSGPYRAGTSEAAELAMPPGLPPAGLAATTSLGTTVTLTWQPVRDATGYRVLRDNALITPQTLRSTSYVDQGLEPGLYTYSVISFFDTEAAGEIQGELEPRSSLQVVLSRCARP
jgi:hypothetical protein